MVLTLYPSCSGLLRLLSGQIQAADVQQGLRVSRLGHRTRLDSGLGLHDLHPHGGGHQDHPIRRAAYRGGRSRCGGRGSRSALVLTLIFLPAEDQGGGCSSSRGGQLTSERPPRPQRALLPAGPQRDQRRAEGAKPHHRRNHDVKEQGGGSP